MRSTVLVTGTAGFIGFHVARRLLEDGCVVYGLDDLNDYYDPTLKESRLEILRKHDTFRFFHYNIADANDLASVFDEVPFDVVIHLAAQAGVRYSLENPRVYVDSNVVGFLNVLENCRRHRIPHLLYASSSSVYGLNEKQPFSEDDAVDHPVSLYAATKKSNELMAHAYSHLYGIPTTGLRFFTVYGPWGRPDMAVFKFTKAILAGTPIDVYNNGRMKRDFTYIDDIVEGIVRSIRYIPMADPDDDLSSPATGRAPYRVYNIGNNKPVKLTELISTIESVIGKKAVVNLLPMQPGDVPETYADIDRLHREVGFTPSTDLKKGIGHFVEWYRRYYRIGS